MGLRRWFIQDAEKYKAEDEEHGCSAKLYMLLPCCVGAVEQ
jgi:hypothetical protein